MVDGQRIAVPVLDQPLAPTSHAGRVETLLRELIVAVEQNTEAVRAVAKAAEKTAAAETKQARAQQAAAARDKAGRGAGVKTR